MNAADLLSVVSRAFLVLLGLITLLDYIRHRDPIRRDIAVLFGLFTLPVAIRLVATASGKTVPQWTTDLSLLALMVEPYILIRLVRYLRPVPANVTRAAFVGLIASILISLVFAAGSPRFVSETTLFYVIIVNVYAMIAFIRGAFTSTGVVRHRLRFTATGSMLLVGIVLGLELQALIPALSGIILLLIPAMMIASATAFYMGFAPPRWLRRIWQFSELNRYLSGVSRKSISERMDIARSMTELCQVANRAVGGMSAGVVQREENSANWLLKYKVGDLARTALKGDGILNRVWQRNEPDSIRRASHLSERDRWLLEDVDAGTMLVIPINVESRIWGMLVIFLRYGSLFIEDDLHMATLLVQQSAMLLENSELVEHLKANSWQVEQTLRLTEALYETSRTLLGAKGYEGIVAAVYEYASKHGATVATLSTIEVDENDQPEWANTVARVGSSNTVGAPVGSRYRLADLSYSKFWIAEPDKVQLVENTLTDPRYDDAMKILIARLGIHANVTMPLATDSGWIGVLGLSWAEPHVFSTLDRQFYNALATLVTQALENERLRVAEQKAVEKLATANHELEAFSYSVSHDLRSPLRAMDGFSQALQEDYADALDDVGKNYLHRIRASSQRMGLLIDDLLELSRLSRSTFKNEKVDLSAMACRIGDELCEAEPERGVKFEVEDGLTVTGDARLLHVVMSNLLSNAWKYTGKQPEPCIHFGMTDRDGCLTYFVRDNGAGFDMAFVNKLFGVFQRLHDAHEFPGNGIGLATVQRIIQRHGGEIWAEAAVNQGATFYFTLA